MDSAVQGRIKEGDLVLVTGGGGYIGSHCVYKLLENGFRVRATVRDPSADKNAFLKTIHPKAATNLEMVSGDLMQTDGWAAALQGVDGVLHVASPFPGKKPEDEQQVIGPAVSGVENVLKEAANAKVKRVVLTSSVAAVLQPVKNSETPVGKVFTEEDWSDPAVQSAYGKSKTLAEKRGWELAESFGIDLVTVQPGFVMGKALSKSSGTDSTSNQTVVDMMMRRSAVLPRYHVSLVDVEDVAEIHIRALTAPKETVVGKRFIAVGQASSSLTEMSTLLYEEFSQYGFNPTTNEAPMPNNAANASTMVNEPKPCSNERSKQILGIQYKDMRQSLKEHALSLIALGILPPKEVPEEMYTPFKPKVC